MFSFHAYTRPLANEEEDWLLNPYISILNCLPNAHAAVVSSVRSEPEKGEWDERGCCVFLVGVDGRMEEVYEGI